MSDPLIEQEDQENVELIQSYTCLNCLLCNNPLSETGHMCVTGNNTVIRIKAEI
jgi:hypothetical protein